MPHINVVASSVRVSSGFVNHRVVFNRYVSMGSKRRRATSPSSSASGGDFDDATSSTPVSGWKRRRAATAPSVDQVRS